jgi:hypothetical protein
MTHAITLESKIGLFRDLLYEGYELGDLHYGIPDYKVMIKLGCTPQSWSRYRPQLIQYCRYNNLIKTEVINEIEMEILNINMKYDKQKKKWYGKRNQLLIQDDRGLWHEMTLEEQENYHIIWSPEDFLYTQHN